MKGYVYRFLDNQENIIYVGSCEDIKQRLRQHFEHGHLDDDCYNNVLYVDYAEFNSRTEAYMYEQYEIAMLQPEYNTNGKINEQVELEYLNLKKLPSWKRLYANSNYGYRYEKVYTNFTEENPRLKNSNRKYVLQDAEILRRFKAELKQNIDILNDIDQLKEKCPTYLSLIDVNDLRLLQDCMVKETMHISLLGSVYREAVSDTDYDEICIDETILKHIEQMNSTEIHKQCRMICVMEDGDEYNYEIDFPYTKKSTRAVWIPALCDKSLEEIENKAIEIINHRRKDE